MKQSRKNRGCKLETKPAVYQVLINLNEEEQEQEEAQEEAQEEQEEEHKQEQESENGNL